MNLIFRLLIYGINIFSYLLFGCFIVNYNCDVCLNILYL